MTELFLRAYFLIEVIAGKLIADRAPLFDRLYSIFLLPVSGRAALYSLVQREAVREIETYGDYAQVCRIQKYAEMTGADTCIPRELVDVIAAKGGALREANQIGYEEYAESTEGAICKLLTESANMGIISSLCALGFLQCEGIFVGKNERQGVKNLDRAARWNSIDGILLSLHYGGEPARRLNLDRLYTVTRGTVYSEVFDAAAREYGGSEPTFIPENNMLKKAFGARILKPEIYSSQHGRFIFSELISLKDKEHALFSGHGEVISQTADLPLKLRLGELVFDGSALAELPLDRSGERERIRRHIAYADLRGETEFRPLCVAAQSEYMLKAYRSALEAAFPTANVELIDVGELYEYDFEPTKNNVFVRSCDEDRQNVYIIYIRGEVSDGVMSAVKNFLRSDKRRRFRLLQPSAVIDLSSILPICFCDETNARRLKTLCDVERLGRVSPAELPELIEYMIAAKARQYRIGNISVDGDARKLLESCSADRADGVIDSVVRGNRGAETLALTRETIESAMRVDAGGKTGYGFGGTDNEGK